MGTKHTHGAHTYMKAKYPHKIKVNTSTATTKPKAPYNQTIPLLDSYLKLRSLRYHTTEILCYSTHNSQHLKSTKMPDNRLASRENSANAQIRSGVLLSHREEYNSVICMEMDASRNHAVKPTKLGSEQQMSHAVSHIHNLNISI